MVVNNPSERPYLLWGWHWGVPLDFNEFSQFVSDFLKTKLTTKVKELCHPKELLNAQLPHEWPTSGDSCKEELSSKTSLVPRS